MRTVEDDPSRKTPATDIIQQDWTIAAMHGAERESLWLASLTFEAYVRAASPADALATLTADLGVVDESRRVARVKDVRATRITSPSATPPPGSVTRPETGPAPA